MEYFDAHTHVQFPEFDADRDAVIRRALDAGTGMVNAGTGLETSRAAVRLARRYENVYATVGKHPEELGNNPKETSDFDRSAFSELAHDPKVVAIGECGLDYHHALDKKTRERQRTLFVEHIKLAHECKKPLVVHCRSAATERPLRLASSEARTSPREAAQNPGADRDAFSDLLDLLITHYQFLLSPHPGISHFFSGTQGNAQKLLELGFYFTFGGVITFVRDYDEVIRMIPAERILSETDAPFVAPVPYRGKRNEPAYVAEVVRQLARIKGISESVMRKAVLENTETIFSIKL